MRSLNSLAQESGAHLSCQADIAEVFASDNPANVLQSRSGVLSRPVR